MATKKADKPAGKPAEKADDQTEKATYRVDQGEALPPQKPFPTGTDNDKK